MCRPHYWGRLQNKPYIAAAPWSSFHLFKLGGWVLPIYHSGRWQWPHGGTHKSYWLNIAIPSQAKQKNPPRPLRVSVHGCKHFRKWVIQFPIYSHLLHTFLKSTFPTQLSPLALFILKISWKFQSSVLYIYQTWENFSSRCRLCTAQFSFSKILYSGWETV